MRPASTSTASWSARSVHSTTNSSPPSRATRSWSRTVARSSRATCDEQLVAGLVPEGVVDGLEAVEVEEQQRQQPRVPAQPVQPGLEVLAQQRAVGQPGERVVQRLRGEARLELLALGDVAQDAGEQAHLGADLADREVERERRAVAPLADDLPADADDAPLPGAAVPVEVAVVLGAVGRRHEHADVAADDLGRRVAEHALRGRVHRHDRPPVSMVRMASTAVSRTARARCSLCSRAEVADSSRSAVVVRSTAAQAVSASRLSRARSSWSHGRPGARRPPARRPGRRPT